MRFKKDSTYQQLPIKADFKLRDVTTHLWALRFDVLMICNLSILKSYRGGNMDNQTVAVDAD